jgi:O-acetyl-ADP-ribose deacetylase (regulator of RNase III)
MDRLSVVVADITKVEVDAIVNAANEWMLGGGGVDGAIHAAAGAQLLAACKAIPETTTGIRCPIGDARITPGFSLPAKFVIHTVGPRWRGGSRSEAELLAQCYRSCLRLAIENGIRSIAFPAISTGAFGYPLADACRIAVSECASFLKGAASIEQIILVAFSRQDAVALREAIKETAGRG